MLSFSSFFVCMHLCHRFEAFKGLEIVIVIWFGDSFCLILPFFNYIYYVFKLFLSISFVYYESNIFLVSEGREGCEFFHQNLSLTHVLSYNYR